MMAELDSMVKIGIVSAIDADTHTARVYFPDKDNMVSDWLKVLQFPCSTGSVDLETKNAGIHKHHVPEHNHQTDISNEGLTTNNAGIHKHTINPHTHPTTISDTAAAPIHIPIR